MGANMAPPAVFFLFESWFSESESEDVDANRINESSVSRTAYLALKR